MCDGTGVKRDFMSLGKKKWNHVLQASDSEWVSESGTGKHNCWKRSFDMLVRIVTSVVSLMCTKMCWMLSCKNKHIVLFFCHCYLTHKIKTTENQKDLFWLKFQMVDRLHCFGSKARQNIMVLGACGRGSCSIDDSQETEKKRK